MLPVSTVTIGDVVPSLTHDPTMSTRTSPAMVPPIRPRTRRRRVGPC